MTFAEKLGNGVMLLSQNCLKSQQKGFASTIPYIISSDRVSFSFSLKSLITDPVK